MTLESAHVARSVFLRVGALAHFPAVPSIIDAGEGPWASFTALSTPPDRRRVLDVLVPRFSEELIPTPAAEERLANWFALHRPPYSRRTIGRDLVVLGLDRVRRTLVAALRRMPAPVVHHVLRGVWILGSERGNAGWAWQAPPYPAGPLQLICLDGKLDLPELWTTFAHEVSHCWLLPVASLDRVPRIDERARAADLPRRMAIQWRRPDLVMNLTRATSRAAALTERQAAALARSWGFVGRAADPDLCASEAALAAMRLPL
jgi:hypothetical protein